MAGEGKGWISLYRSIQDHWLWQEKPFDKARAWLDLLLLANHQDNKFLLGNELVEVKKGSFITSQAKLMERWGWGKEKVRTYLKLLEKEEMLKIAATKKYTLIKIINYESYQNQTSTKPVVPMDNENYQTTNRPQSDRKQTTNRPRADSNNNDNNENNVNKDNKSVYKRSYGEFKNVKLTDDEYNTLLSTHTAPFIEKYIKKLSLHIESEGKVYKSHYATLKKWIYQDSMKSNYQIEEPKKDEYALDVAKIRKQLLGMD
ncbi:MAG: DnaD domain protein [Clostridium sp.]